MAKPPKWTVNRIRALKGHPFACVTAVDAATGRLADEADLPVVLVGDSLAMTALGHETTLPVTLDQMVYHATAVARGARRALLVGDMPFLSYQGSEDDAVIHAGRFLKEAGMDAVKLEGGRTRAGLVRRMVDNGIPVMGHIGLLPQSVRAMGGYKVQGRDTDAVERLLDDARALDDAGVFALVLEGMPPGAARQVTETVAVPTIGIGAGPHCDGQILVMHDLLGLGPGYAPKFVKRYAELGAAVVAALRAYREDVEQGRFPSSEHTYS
jgi:3-methyl-2-oxobutanoate hydroxymethyltransferase